MPGTDTRRLQRKQEQSLSRRRQIAEAHQKNPPTQTNLNFKSRARVIQKLQRQGINTREETRKRERQANLERIEKERLQKLIDEKIQKLVNLRIKMVNDPSSKNETAKEYEKEFKLLMNIDKK